MKDGKKIIPAGKSLQDIFTTLLLKENWPNSVPTATLGTVGISVGNPSVSTKPSGLYEVGTEVTVSDMKTGTISSTSAATKFNGNFTYGYYDVTTKTKTTTDNSKPSDKSVTNIELTIPEKTAY